MKKTPNDRVIVALDVPTGEEALAFVEELKGLVSFYKIGLELLVSGGAERLLKHLTKDHQVFVDLKLPNDIPETVRRVTHAVAEMGVKFLTLSNSVTPDTIHAAVEGRSAHADPQLLFVPFLSSLDRSDFEAIPGAPGASFEDYLMSKTATAKAAGANGFIVSGQEIQLLRKWYPEAVLVSPGIRPAGAAKDDHKRMCTPAEAIRMGADYIVVGRPVRNAPDRRRAAQLIIDEVAAALETEPPGSSSASSGVLTESSPLPVGI
jgi:orotidine-5'-phosphate decarboxylase